MHKLLVTLILSMRIRSSNLFKVWAVSILILATILRFIYLGQIPVSLYWDEVAQGYNAYSLLKTGKDEYGIQFPFHFRSFDDNKNPGYIYLSMLPVSLFGLNEFSVRLTSALLGSLTVVLITAIAFEMLHSSSRHRTKSRKFALLSGLLLAISPWHLQFSRAAFEANAGLFFLVLGVWSFLRIQKSPWWWYVSVLGFGTSVYFYRSFYIVAPLLLFSALWLFRQQVRKMSKLILVSGILLAVLISMPVVNFSLTANGLLREQQVQVFDKLEEETYASAQKILAHNNVWWARVIYNRRLVVAQTVAQNYFRHFLPDFLFLRGDGNGRHSVSGMGYLYLWQFPFLLCGVYWLLKANDRWSKYLIVWLLVSPIPASLAVPSPHALRSLTMVVPMTLIIAFGLTQCILTSRYILLRSLLIATAGILFFIYFDSYYHKSAVQYAQDWADGYKQLVHATLARQSNYDKTLISGYFWKPYIYYLFYTTYDPALFQKEGSSRGFDRWVFGGTYWGHSEQGLESVRDLRVYAKGNNILVALSSSEYNIHKRSVGKLEEIKDRKGNTVFITGEVNDETIKKLKYEEFRKQVY